MQRNMKITKLKRKIQKAISLMIENIKDYKFNVEKKKNWKATSLMMEKLRSEPTWG